MAKRKKTIELENVRKIKQLSIELLPEGGVIELLGRNGAGKTSAIDAVQSLMRGSGSIECRDGARSGRVEGCGVKITVGRNTRRAGELTVNSIEGRFDLATLVDPKIKDRGAADDRRIKTLVELSGRRADPALFYPLFGGKESFEKFATVHTVTEETDLVTMAGKIKRELESEARKQEQEAERAEAGAKAKRDVAEGVDVDGANVDELNAAFERAAIERERLRKQADDAAKDLKTRQDSFAELERYEKLDAPDLGSLQENWTAASQTAADAKKAVAKLESELEIARHALLTREAEEREAKALFEKHREMDERVQALVKIVSAPKITAPSLDDMAAADNLVESTRKAVVGIGRVAEARAALADAEKLSAEARKAHARAERLREAAKGTDHILSEAAAIEGSPLRVEGGRLVVDTERGVTEFCELSAGERWRIALDIGIAIVLSADGDGLLPISQEAWEGLDPINRDEINARLYGTGVNAITARCTTDREVTARAYEPSGAADE